MKTHSFKKRFTAKLSSNLFKFIFNIVTLGIIPRELGPETYGDFGYLTHFFNKTMKFLKFGVPTAYFIKLSKNLKDRNFIGFYQLFILFLIIFLFALIVLIKITGIDYIVFPDQKYSLVIAAALLSIFMYLVDFMRSTNDSFGLTVNFETTAIISNFIRTALVFLLFFLNLITIESVFLLNYFALAYLIIYGARILYKNKIYFLRYFNFTKLNLVSYLKEIYIFSHPLFINGFVIFIAVMFDRWLLQYYYGSIEQGYFTLGWQISGTLILIVSPVSTLLLRDMSVSFKKADLTTIKKYFLRSTNFLYSFIAFFAVFIFLNSEFIAIMIGGMEYINASLVIGVMALYAMHQIYSLQVSNILLVKESTNILRNVTLLTMLPGLLLTIYLVAPKTLYGLELGAEGLALKTLIIQFFAVNAYLWIVSNYLKISFIKNIIYQVLIPILFFILVQLSQFISFLFFTDKGYNFFLLSGFFYTIATAISLYFFPRVFGISQIDFDNGKLRINELSKKYFFKIY
jgi:O-antigen/teichoic acid export membrane protein